MDQERKGKERKGKESWDQVPEACNVRLNESIYSFFYPFWFFKTNKKTNLAKPLQPWLASWVVIKHIVTTLI